MTKMIELADLIGQAAADEVVALRRRLHANPEIGMDTAETAEAVEAALARMGITDIERFAGNGLAAAVQGGRPGPMIGFRADMDALPIQEETDLPYKSTRAKRAHLCGHDGHTAGLVAFAHWLVQHKYDFAGTAVLIFQPGEEGYAGADKMIQDGLFEKFPVKEMYGIHNAGLLPFGKIRVRAGAMSAAADLVEFTVEGKGGHGARPHQAIDPMPAAASLILTLQTVVSRSVDPQEAGVVSLCAIEGGDPGAPSVIPQRIRIAGTTRSLAPEVRDLIEQRCRETAAGVGLATGTQIECRYTRLYPPLMNDKALLSALTPVLIESFGRENVETEFKPAMGGEDFAFFAQKVPSVFFHLGIADESHACSMHHPKFDFNDRIFGAWVTLLTDVLKARSAA